MKCAMRAAAFVLALTAAGAALAQPPAQTQTAIVCDDGECPAISLRYPSAQIFSTLTAALGAARLAPIGRIVLTAGEWTAATVTDLQAPLIIEGDPWTTRPWQVVITSGLEISGGAIVAVEGLVIEGGTGGTVRVLGGPDSRTKVDLNRVHLRGAEGGPALRVVDSDVLLVNSVVTDRAAPAVEAIGSADVKVLFSTIIGNAAPVFEVDENAGATATNNLIEIADAANLLEGDGALSGTSNAFWPMDEEDEDDLPPGIGNSIFFDPVFTGSDNNPAQLSNTVDAGLVPINAPIVDATGAEIPVHGVAFPEGRYDRLDFKGNPRPLPGYILPGPQAGQYDIGADEIFFPGAFGASCIVEVEFSPNIIGRLPAGALSIEVWLTGPIDAARLETQLGAEIPLDIVSSGVQQVRLTNSEPIETRRNDVVVDGVAELVLFSNGVRMTPCDGMDVNLNVLIDTTPPRMVYPVRHEDWRGVSDPSYGFSITGAPAHLVPDATFLPALPGQTVGVPSGSGLQWTDAVTSGGGATGAEPNGLGPHLFFNPGAVIRPGATADNLEFSLAVVFEDLPPEGAPTNLPVAGFSPALAGTYTGRVSEVLQNRNTDPPLPLWLIQQGLGSALLDTDEFEVKITLNGQQNSLGYYNKMTVTWRTEGPDHIPWSRVGNDAGNIVGPFRDQTWHVATRFSATDAAGNSIELHGTLRDPLHLWWHITNDVFLQPAFPRRMAPESLFFSWEFRRRAAPSENTNPVTSWFTFRLYEETAYDFDGEQRVFEPIGDIGTNGWRSWTTASGVGPEWFINNGIVEGYNGKWLMMVVLGVDEAGNLTPWPFAGDPNRLVLRDSDSGSNWVRFYIEPPEESVTLQVTPSFWWENNETGDRVRSFTGPIVPQAPRDSNLQLKGEFRMRAIGIEHGSAGSYRIRWELEEAGVKVDELENLDVSLDGSAGPVVQNLPHTAPLGPNEDGRPYVFRARVVREDGVEMPWTNYSFTVVRDASRLVTPGARPEDQVFRVYER